MKVYTQSDPNLDLFKSLKFNLAKYGLNVMIVKQDLLIMYSKLVSTCCGALVCIEYPVHTYTLEAFFSLIWPQNETKNHGRYADIVWRVLASLWQIILTPFFFVLL